jgi:hypothetical protein
LIVLDRIETEDVERVWPFVLPMLTAACDATGTDLTPDFIKEEALADRRTLWVIFDTDDPFGPFLAAFATGERLTAQGRVVFIDALGGRNRGCWLAHCLSELEVQAKAMGAVRLELEGRPAWRRVLPGYREVRTVLAKEL